MNIDVSKIDGYEQMTPEDKIKALEGYEFEPQPSADGDVEKLKQALSKANSEAADWKRQYREKLSAEEKEKAEREELEKQKDAELESYRKAATIRDSEAFYLSLGYDADLAKSTAEAEYDNDTKKCRENHKAFLDAYAKKVLKDSMDSQRKTTPGTPLDPENIKKTEEEKLRGYFGL